MLSLEQYYKSFKAYDIRGIRDKEIDADLGYYLGLGLGKYIIEQKGTNATILIAADTRANNTQLINNTLLGLQQAGCTCFVSAGIFFENYPHGICSTATALSLGYEVADYSIIFSASHNTSEYIGVKTMQRGNFSVKTSLLKDLFTQSIQKHQEKGFVPLNDQQAIALYQDNNIFTKPKKKLTDLLDEHFGQLTQTHNFTIDYGHGAAVAYELDYINNLSTHNSTLSTLNLFTTPDGNFPAHETDTSRFSNYEKLTETIRENNSDFGFMFDGDADRLGIVLKNGTVITGDILTAIVAKQLLTNGIADTFGSKEISYEVFSSQVVKETAKQYGGTSKMIRVGRGAFCEQFIQEKGLLAGESSAHILFGPFGYCEIPLLALALILKESELFASFDDMAKQYMSRYKSQVYHFAISTKDELIQHIDDAYPNLTKSYVDGVRMDGDNFWFTIRKSGTEDIVKVAGEADTKEEFDREWNKLKKIIVEYGGHEE